MRVDGLTNDEVKSHLQVRVPFFSCPSNFRYHFVSWQDLGIDWNWMYLLDVTEIQAAHKKGAEFIVFGEQTGRGDGRLLGSSGTTQHGLSEECIAV